MWCELQKSVPLISQLAPSLRRIRRDTPSEKNPMCDVPDTPPQLSALASSSSDDVIPPRLRRSPSSVLYEKALRLGSSHSKGLFFAHEHFLDRYLTLVESKRDVLSPLATWRITWRWAGSFLLLLYSLSLLHTSWINYRCDADEFCVAADHHGSAPESRRLYLGIGVRSYSAVEVVYGMMAPRPSPTSGGTHGHFSVESTLAAVHLWRLNLLSMPINVLLTVPWFDVFAALSCSSSGSDDGGVGTTNPIASESKRPLMLAALPPVGGWLQELKRRWHTTPLVRTWMAVVRVRRLAPPPPLLKPLLEEYVVPIIFARNFGKGLEAVPRLVSALPAIGDALWEVEITQAFLVHFVASAKVLVLIMSSLHTARTRMRLKRRRQQVREQLAARRVAKHARKFLVLSNVGHLQQAARTTSQLAAIERYRHRGRRMRRARASNDSPSE